MSCLLLNFLVIAELCGAENRILFSGKINNVWDIYTCNTDGEDVKAVTDTLLPEGNPIFWHRKNLVLSSFMNDEGRFGIQAIDLSGKIVWSYSEKDCSIGWPCPSPFDDRILAVCEASDASVRPGVINFPEKKFDVFFENENYTSGGQMAWIDSENILVTRTFRRNAIFSETVREVRNSSTSGNLISGRYLLESFMTDRSESSDILTRSITGNDEKVLVSGGRNWLPCSNPTNGGSPFFFTRRVGQISSIFSLFKDNSNVWNYENVTNSRIYDWQPSISPDGSQLIFLSLRDGNFRIILREIAENSEREIVLKGFEQIFHPTIISTTSRF
ncbi:MAG: PD40 domain-containing protein [Candidatus Riflebacteria bacterium]|nr:PD40 domain-containing protein [Candidatus Riflebacteria bacterium]